MSRQMALAITHPPTTSSSTQSVPAPMGPRLHAFTYMGGRWQIRGAWHTWEGRWQISGAYMCLFVHACVCVCVVHRGVLADQRCACGCHGGSAGGCRGLTSRHNLTPVLILLPPSRTRTHHIILPSPRNCSPPSPLCSSLQTILMPMANAQLMKINSNSTFYSYQWRWAGVGP